MSFSEISLGPLSRVIGMRVVITDHVLAALSRFLLNPNLVTRINVVTIVRRISSGVTGTRDRSDNARPIIAYATEKDAAAFVRVGFFTMTANDLVISGGDFYH